jgi:hypothetical protein
MERRVEVSGHVFSHPELKITAILYANNPNVVLYLKATGKLPEEIPNGGFPIGMRVIIERRGMDPELREDEQLVYEAILRERRLPGGGVNFVSGRTAETA